MKIVKTITVEGISDADCNQKIVDALDNLPRFESNPTPHDYKFGKIGLIKLLRDYDSLCTNKSLFGIKQFVEEYARKHER